MKHWLRDGAFRSLLRNAVSLCCGSVVSALLGLLALSCAGKGMTPRMFGVLVVIQAYNKAVSDLIKFQTWQFVVQFGTPALQENNTGRFREVVRFSFGLDIVSSLIAITGGIGLLPFLTSSLGLDRETLWLAMVYCTLIPSMTSSTPTGILRALDRFDLIAIQQAVRPFLQAAGSVICYYFRLGFAGFMISWYIANLAGGSLFWWFAGRELKRRNIRHALKPALFGAARNLHGAWDFVWTTNIAHTLWAARNSCSTVLVGLVSGPAAAGLFKIAMTFYDATGTPARLLEKSFYPEVMRLDPRTSAPWRLGLRAALMAGGLGIAVALLVLVAGEPLITAVFGHQYLAAYDLIKIMLGATIVSMLGFPLESLLLMAGKQRAFLIYQVLACFCYLILLTGSCYLSGVRGAAYAYFAGQCLSMLLTLIPTLRAYRGRHRPGRIMFRERQ
ncbi:MULTISPECIES: lipopolysaccharide biosynthesis protein [unclassified Tatumella]|uniref:lipopolysaccharide biosynthesis protein n=1 Tax=unclassified Tatumella TaxID=2649542 RepID=UPI001BB091BE|nr:MULTISPECIES: lipopolysaccharide biosynthesis protein [unclassified Tatumella]MBS0856048.1 lipopolysaccharide biosynthesis protein [Tatumella sp. JGM16]MBS0913027.1 lipopolysaccharide biosynthesis protein [Tatumella sp. JGM91]